MCNQQPAHPDGDVEAADDFAVLTVDCRTIYVEEGNDLKISRKAGVFQWLVNTFPQKASWNKQVELSPGASDRGLI